LSVETIFNPHNPMFSVTVSYLHFSFNYIDNLPQGYHGV